MTAEDDSGESLNSITQLYTPGVQKPNFCVDLKQDLIETVAI